MAGAQHKQTHFHENLLALYIKKWSIDADSSVSHRRKAEKLKDPNSLTFFWGNGYKILFFFSWPYEFHS
jgi:hypothetical protein